MIKKYTQIFEADSKSKAYPIDTNISTDLDKIRKHFNDNVIKNYKTKVLILAYSDSLSNPEGGKYILLSDDFTDQIKSLFNLAFSELKVQVEVIINQNKKDGTEVEENATISSMESNPVDPEDYDVKFNFYLYWKNIKDMTIQNLKIATYKTLDRTLFYVSSEDKDAIQKIGPSKFSLVSKSKKEEE